MSITISQFIPPYPLSAPSLLGVHTFVLLTIFFSFLFFFRFHIYVLAYGISFSLSDLLHSVWQSLGPSTSLQITPFRSFLYMCRIFFIHSTVDGHLGCFHVLAIVNRAAVNILVHDSFWIMVFSGYMPSSGIAGL